MEIRLPGDSRLQSVNRLESLSLIYYRLWDEGAALRLKEFCAEGLSLRIETVRL